VNKQLLHVSVAAMVLLAALLVSTTYWQTWAVGDLADRQDNAIQLVSRLTAFVAGINEQYKHDPGFYTAGPYTALLIIEEALKTTKGNTDDAAAFLKAKGVIR